MAEVIARFGGSNRDGDYDLRWPEGAEGSHGRAHARAGGEAVVDEDGSLAPHIDGWTPVAVQLLAAEKLGGLPADCRLDRLRRDAKAPDDVIVQNADAAGRDCAHGELLVAGDPELAHDENVERGADSACDLKGDRDTAAGQAEDDRFTRRKLAHEFGEYLSGFSPVAKGKWHGTPPQLTVDQGSTRGGLRSAVVRLPFVAKAAPRANWCGSTFEARAGIDAALGIATFKQTEPGSR